MNDWPEPTDYSILDAAVWGPILVENKISLAWFEDEDFWGAVKWGALKHFIFATDPGVAVTLTFLEMKEIGK